MADPKNLENLVAQSVDDVLSSLLPGLREQLIHKVLQALAPELAAAAQPAPAPADDTSKLNTAFAAIQSGTTQVEILDAMIEGASKFAARTALFVVRGASAVGWRARGFDDNESVRSSPLELREGLAGKAIEARTMVSGTASEFAVDFAEKHGVSNQDSVMLPLMVRDKAVALLYGDGGLGEHQLDPAALQSLVRTTGLWLEVFATRKAGGVSPISASAPVAHPAEQAMAAAAAASVAAPALVAEPQPHQPEPVPIEEAKPVGVPVPPPAPTGEEAEIHKKARRFAKLLVDEIKLYNQSKVTEGRQNRDLYDRLKEDIEKSRASYEKRYGNSAAKEGDYFNQELVRILADNDSALLGNNFRR